MDFDLVANAAAERPPGVGLRQFKHAGTRLGLLKAAVERIAEKPFAEVTVGELCAEVGISEPTFFNYFPRKDDLLFYYVDLWRIEVPARAARAAGGRAGLGAIEAIFDEEARGIAARPRMMFEIIVWKSRQTAIHRTPEITRAERLIAFPDLPEALDAAPLPQADLFARHLRAATARGELPAATAVETAVIALVSLFYGVPLALGAAQADAIGRQYTAALELLWRALRNHPASRR